MVSDLWLIDRNLNTYYSNDLPKHCKIYLAENDEIVNVEYVNAYLQRFESKFREVTVMKNMRHGQYVLSGDYRALFASVENVNVLQIQSELV